MSKVGSVASTNQTASEEAVRSMGCDTPPVAQATDPTEPKINGASP
jgi:hypothetical protein